VVGEFGAPRGKWVDVGFGNGALLCTAQEWGFEAFGLDLRADAVAGLSRFGIAGAVSTIEAHPGAQSCSVISMADVLEHMPFPETALRAAHRLLADDGVLFISTPNRDTAVWKALDQSHANPYWSELEHCHNFSRESLYRLLLANGFAPAAYNVSHRYASGMDVMARKIA
jgi:SAM-dependent methyltransferase